MSITFNLGQAKELVDFFGGEDAEIIVTEGNGHSGIGLYAYFLEYPEEGAIFLGEEEEDD